jgi:pectate lyase
MSSSKKLALRAKMQSVLAVSALAVTATAVSLSLASSAQAATPTAGSVYQLAVTKSGLCIDVPSASTANNALLQQWGCSSGATWQQFRLIAVGGNYQIQNINSGKCIDVPNFSTASGIQLQQYTCVSSQTNQQWKLTASGSGTYQIINVDSGLCISDQGASTVSGTAIIQETCTANTNKQWAFHPISGRTWSNAADGFASTGGGTTGGAAGTTVTVSTFADLVKYATSSTAYVIKIPGTITVTPYGYEIPVTSNKTLIGVGATGKIKNGGIFLGSGVSNVIIRNLTIGETEMTDDDPDDKTYDYDGIQMDTANHIWIDHNLITKTNDGLIDSRKDTSYLTVSWNVLSNHNKTFGIGWTDNVTARMTIHHNWFYNTNQRNPSVDNVALAHMYNNYLQNITSYGNLSRGATKLVLENSYFDNVANPWNIDDPSIGQLKQSGSIVVNSSGKQVTGGSAFTPSSYYSYTLDPAANVPALVKEFAGPQANLGL